MSEFSTQVKTEIPVNVKSFINKWAGIAGKYHGDGLEVDCLFVSSSLCQSPIEQLFYSAITVVLDMNDLSSKEIILDDDKIIYTGVDIMPQERINKYRIDFGLYYYNANIVDISTDRKKICMKIAVELDGQAFHDTDEKQRRYEKARDRFLQKKGFKVFRYTGSEIVRDPFAAALECIAYLIGADERDLAEVLNTYGEYKHEVV